MKETFWGWSEIAQYIGKSITTAQRYERTLALPVRRTGKGPKAPVHALKTELDAWLRGKAGEHIKTEVREEIGRHPSLFSSTDQAVQAHVLDRVHALTDLTLYRRNYHMHFDLKPGGRGVRANIALKFELLNASAENQPYVQEITIDDADHGHVDEMVGLKNGVTVYALKNPQPTERRFGYSAYRGEEMMIEPEVSGISYVYRSSWIINRGDHELWYNHMALPTVGITIETEATPEFEITASYSIPHLVLTGEHLDIAWYRRK